MDLQTDALGILDLVTVPGFCVKNNQIIKCNTAAQGLFLTVGTDIRELLLTGKEEYSDFRGGCLYLSITCQGNTWGASVTRTQDADIFLLEQNPYQPELQALALAARELRSPLSNTMLITNQLLQQNPQEREAHARLNRGLHQLLRIIDNMSDAEYWYAGALQETRNITSLMGEILEKASQMAEATGIRLEYTLPEERIFTVCSAEQLERAVLNMLSNAIKFTPKDGIITVSLVRQGNTLRISMRDSGSGIADEILRTVFTRYLRRPVIEDGRHGIGLGMVLIRNTAASHGGTVLIDRPEEGGTRVTLTLAIRSNAGNLSAPVTCPLAGGYDPALTYLADVLPYDLYDGTR